MSDLFEKCGQWQDAKRLQAAGLYPFFRAIEQTAGTQVVTHGKKRVMIGSNNYLGLTHHPRVQAAAKAAIDEFGTGCTGSRFLNGNLKTHELLEAELAQFLNKEACIVFATGFLANQGAISAIVDKDDVIYSDRENHASIIEGTRLAPCKTIRYQHNNPADFERVLKETRHLYKGALMIADGVFSMSGDTLKLSEFSAIAKKYNVRTYVDDAHALGVLGPEGQGTEFHFENGQGMADIVMGTFSKSFASLGGYIAGPKEVIHYLKHKARTLIFSASMPPAAVGAVRECLKIVQEDTSHVINLRRNAAKMSKELKNLGFQTLGSQTPIIPLLIGDDILAFAFTQKLYENGLFCAPVVRPGVPDGCALIRTSYMATHTDEDLDFALDVLEKVGKEFGIIGNAENESKLSAIAHQHFGHAMGLTVAKEALRGESDIQRESVSEASATA